MDNLESEGHFFLHRQLIASPETSAEPVQLVFPDNSTTIAYRTDSVEKIVRRVSGEQGGTVEPEQASNDTKSLVVFASLSDPEGVQAYAAPYRVACLTVLSAHMVVLAGRLLVPFMDAEDEGMNHSMSIFELVFWVGWWLVDVLLIVGIKRRSPATLAFVNIFHWLAMIIAMRMNPFHGTEREVTAQLYLLGLTGSLWYLSNTLKNAFMPQTFLVKQVD